MDSKITLSFNGDIIDKARQFAASQNISLSRLTEFLYSQIISGHYRNLEEFPISEWVNTLAEGKAEYKIKPRQRKVLKEEYFKAKK